MRRMAIGIIGLAAGLALLTQLGRVEAWLKLLFFLRVPLLALVFMVVFPLLVVERMPTFFKKLFVVCASGGGIQAAAWATRVLSGFHKKVGPSWTNAIGLVSAVSGGSVGAMQWLDRFEHGGELTDQDAEEGFEAATGDGLPALAWGLAYPDFLRLGGLGFLVPARSDRGRAVELAWRGFRRHPDAIATQSPSI